MQRKTPKTTNKLIQLPCNSLLFNKCFSYYYLFASFIFCSFTVDAQVIQILSPNSGKVGQYNLIEFTTEIPTSVQTSIQNYFGAGGYGTNYNDNFINPYDPDEISIEAKFTCLSCTGQPSFQGWGFFYRDFSYNTTQVAQSTNCNNQQFNHDITWRENINLQNHWRVRFAPKFLGNWKVTYLVRVNGLVVHSDIIGTTFTSIPSTNKGFLEFGSNGKFLQHTNQSPIFPAGVCVGWPEPEKYDCSNNSYWPIEYIEHRERIKKVFDGGGNYTKVVFSQYSYGIEWEHLNNYDNRQMLMWEFDNLLTESKNNELYIHLVMELGEGFSFVRTNYPYNWDKNPYKNLTNVSTVEDYYTDSEAIKIYKNRVRYMIARWGFSTQISTWELLNEVETIKEKINDSFPDTNNALTFWHEEISDYIKNGLKHTNHLISASFSRDLFDIGHDQNIDFLNQHDYYSLGRNAAKGIYQDHKYFDIYNKPVFISEFGAAHYGGCNLNPNDNFYIDYAYPTHHNTLWSSSFTGSPIAGLEWWEKGLDYGLYMNDIKILKEFFKPHNLDAGNFVRSRFEHPNDNLEAYMLINKNGQNSTQALGWVHNKSYYWYNFIQDPNCAYYDTKLHADHNSSNCPNYNPPDDDNNVCPLEGDLGDIVLEMQKLTRFGVEWFNTTTGESLKIEEAHSDFSGNLVLSPPLFSNCSHDYAFKVREYKALGGINDDLNIASVTASGKDEIIMINRLNQMNGAIRSENLETNNYTWVSHGIDEFDGWMDVNDRSFVGDINNDNVDEVILVNTSYSGSAIRVVNSSTGANHSWFNHGTYNGWMDNTDGMFVGDVNADGNDDLLLVGVGYVAGAIRAVDLNTGNNISWLNHGTYGGWMDSGDKMFVGDVNNDGAEDLVLVNTDYSGGAIRAIDVVTGNNIALINHGTYGGWMDSGDKMFLGDVNNDGAEDIVLINTTYSGGAIRAIDVLTGNNIALINHGSFNGWFDADDKVILEDLNNDGQDDLIMFNTGTGANLRVLDIIPNNNLALATTSLFDDFKNCNDKLLVGDLVGTSGKDLLFVNTSYSGNVFVVYDMSSRNFSTKNYNAFYPGLTGWLDGSNLYNICTSP